MKEIFDQLIRHEFIILSDLKNLDLNDARRSCYRKEDIIKYIKNLEQEKDSIEDYYEINNEKSKELEKVFGQIKLKINFNSKPRTLRDGKLYTILNDCFTIYDDKFYNKIYEIKFEDNIGITTAIILDNKDLVFCTKSQLIIYRLKNKEYNLFQKIDKHGEGYKLKMTGYCCRVNYLDYEVQFIKDISGNRFICVSNYGFEIYSLNDKNEYSIFLLEKIKLKCEINSIYELDKDNFIFCVIKNYTNLFVIKINLKEITKYEKDKKIYQGHLLRNEDKNIIESLKYTYNKTEIFTFFDYKIFNYFKGDSTLKNKYFIFSINNNIIIFDIFSAKILKRYEILVEEKDTVYKYDYVNIIKWNNKNNNEFIININGNIILFELTNDNELKIINQTYFKDIKILHKVNEKCNKFFNDNRFEYNSFKKNNENEKWSSFIFY